MLSIVLAALALGGVVVDAGVPTAVSFDSKGWYGIDGNWSAIEFFVGEPGQLSHVLVSTTISEFWVVGAGGCAQKDPLCSRDRGDIFTLRSSKSWFSLGVWQLGLDYLGIGGNGDYGLETVSADSDITNRAFSMNNVITAAINSTDFFLGFFGLGITQGSFGDKVAESPLTQAVKAFGLIPSYSYGYTAGAYYIGAGMPSSLTLGGYDEARLVPHQTNFNLNQSDGMAHALIRGISLSPTAGTPVPSHWTSDRILVSNMTTSFGAMIDSTTPYLWMPDLICDRIAEALNLTYNDTMNVYTITNEQLISFVQKSFSFTFTLSSSDNVDDFGRPLDMPGVVNITISSAAFAQIMRSPSINESTRRFSSGVPYFPLRRLNGTSDAIIGRAFLQESYLITRYDSATFTLHQALFPDDPIKGAKIVTIERPPNSPYPPPPPMPEGSSGLSTAQMAGIGAGIFVLCVVMLLAWWWMRRRRKARAAATTVEDADKDNESSIVPEGSQKAPVVRILSKIIRRKRSRKPSAPTGSTDDPAEVGADASHELYELAAPFGPAELDACSDSNSLHGDTELGTTQGTEGLTAYELARRKMERQLQGPVPAYTPSATCPAPSSSGEKSMQDVSPIATYRPSEPASPTAPSPSYGSSGTFPNDLPSPMSPHGDWPTNRIPNLPSPLTVVPPFPSPLYTGSSTLHSGPSSGSGPNTLPPLSVSPHSQTFDPAQMARSNSANTSPASPSGSLVPPSPIYQRTPIDPSRVICLGPLPENVQLPTTKSSIPRIVGTDGRSIPISPLGTMPTMHPTANRSTSTLGSNYTDEEAEEITRHASMSQGQAPRRTHSGSTPASPRGEPSTPRSQERIDTGSELIHVPQLAERRYSWEEPVGREEHR